ncbi:hypothetical protein [uncultured Brevibacillus sp.]|nr:hypothetical protein [uncultured Brevibacillus sp.]
MVQGGELGTEQLSVEYDFSISSFVDGEINQKVMDAGSDTIADLAK